MAKKVDAESYPDLDDKDIIAVKAADWYSQLTDTRLVQHPVPCEKLIRRARDCRGMLHSRKKAERMGIPERQRVFPHALD